jgi:hypothetical protein
MGKATKQRQPVAKRGKRAPRDVIAGPTLEQTRHGDYVRAGVSYKRVPVIDTMLTRQQITHEQHRLLAHYRDQAQLAERSQTKSCLDQRIGGGANDDYVPAVILSAKIETGRIERDLGSLLDITRAICVEDKTLTEWCVGIYGGRERYDGKGKFIAIVPNQEAVVMKRALAEIRYAAGMIVA